MSIQKDAGEQIKSIDVEVSIPRGDIIRLHLQIKGDEICASRLTGIGCPEVLEVIAKWRPKLQGKLSDLENPKGNGHAEMLLRECLMKSQGRWQFPYTDEELCHCRAVPTARVDAAIVAGCHTVAAVSRETTAGTQCGTCRPDIEKVLKFRLT